MFTEPITIGLVVAAAVLVIGIGVIRAFGKRLSAKASPVIEKAMQRGRVEMLVILFWYIFVTMPGVRDSLALVTAVTATMLLVSFGVSTYFRKNPLA